MQKIKILNTEKANIFINLIDPISDSELKEYFSQPINRLKFLSKIFSTYSVVIDNNEIKNLLKKTTNN